MSTFAIAGRELRSLFTTVTGWLVLTGYLFLTGFFWTAMASMYAMQSQDAIVSPYMAAQVDMTDYLVAPFFGNTAIVWLMFCPALSMRLFASERKDRTLELLLTAPVSTAEIVLGKFFGALGFVAVMLACTAHYPLLLMRWGNPDLGAFAAAYLGTLLLAGGLLAMGMLFSAFTESQVVAFVLTVAAGLTLWVFSWVGGGADSLASQIAIVTHAQDLFRGILRLSDIAYFIAFIGVFLFATHQRVESFRWS
ncbi:MAG: ABC transporter permease subunit [Proteobacteria bacterium]|nr:ABC transporter permease subunit [Pseudomonadota bacterium]